MSVDNGSFRGPPPGPQQPHQPRWAWWVVGIVIPLVGIIVTVMASRPGSSDDNSAQSAPPQSSAATGSTGQDQSGQAQPSTTKSAGAVRAVFGPKDVDADTTNAGSYIELDTPQPLVSPTKIKGGDIIFSASVAPNLFVPDSAPNLAPLPPSGPAPTAAECADSVERNATYTANVKRGDRFCLLTGENRVAYLRVVFAPSTGTGKLNITVWNTPDA
ncbi:hypothetical protein [Streptomyces sp. HUAS TT20]|uniref:hypothetical protein n=1 Tax=Streptomyces sp. HUAS TT20 TaxID=3447509 RepID=UPI0021D97890|nr:hypothetical protein [Streptomyces sp. HUAS 15-9]UXY29581.1 hypothetical protein N8I87_25520 [Streptomyces sp. HUAS 15-9]